MRAFSTTARPTRHGRQRPTRCRAPIGARPAADGHRMLRSSGTPRHARGTRGTERPMKDDFSIDVDRTGDTVTLALHGELDITTVDRLRTTLADQADGSSALVVDLHDLAFIDSSGLALLLELNARLDGRPPVRFTRPSPTAARVLQLTRVGDLLSWHNEPR